MKEDSGMMKGGVLDSLDAEENPQMPQTFPSLAPEVLGDQEETYRKFLLAKFLQAMREDLAEWICSLSYETDVNADNFLAALDNGVILCQQARLIQRYAEEYAVLNPHQNLRVPRKCVHYTEKGAVPGSFVARDNVANFITWCRELGIPDVVLFESEDLVLHRNEKNVILTILDVARKAFRFGVQPPQLVQFEQEIDREIERDKEDESLGRLKPRVVEMEEDNDLDTLVRNVVNKCRCSCRFPVKKLDAGKYKIGKNDTLIFVRVMRKHVMVRVGGGWDTLDHYVEKHDPCRTKIAGNIDTSGLKTEQLTPSQKNIVTPARKASRIDGSTASSDTWSMGSSESSGSVEGIHACSRTAMPTSGSNVAASQMATSRKASSIGRRPSQVKLVEIEDQPETSVSLTKSIQELDVKLRLLENARRLDPGLKDTGVYENRGDRWLRSHLNTLKQGQVCADSSGHVNPRQEFARQRGFSDLVQPSSVQREAFAPGMRVMGKENAARRHRTCSQQEVLSSLDQACAFSTPGRNRSNSTALSSTSPFCTPSELLPESRLISTSTQTIDDYARSVLPRPLRRQTGPPLSAGRPSSSRIPRPAFNRSRTMDGSITAGMRKRNSPAQSIGDEVGVRREKSQDTFTSGSAGRLPKSKPRIGRTDSTMNDEKPIRVRSRAEVSVH